LKTTTRVACLTAVLLMGLTGTGAAQSPVRIPFQFSFQDTDPCTGVPMTVTIQGISFVRDINGRVVNTSYTLNSTDTGYAGHGTETLVVNGQNNIFRQVGVLTNDATGHQFVARTVFLLDLSTGVIKLQSVDVSCVR
jgi:hypothetical protein